MERVEHCIYVAPRTKHRPAGYKVVKFVTDQHGDRRKVSEVFRGRDALDRARRFRDEIESDKRRQRYYKEPVRKVDKTKVAEQRLLAGDLMALFELGTLTQAQTTKEDEPKTITLSQYVELGLRADIDGNLTIDPHSNERGYLRRIIEETGANNQKQQINTWSIIQSWGHVTNSTIDQLSGDTVDDFVRYLEGAQSNIGKPYSAVTIRRYRSILMAIIKALASHCEVNNPLDKAPPKKNPARVKGAEKKIKVPTESEMKELEDGFRKQLKTHIPHHLAPRQWAWHVHQVLRSTGCRPGEVLALTEASIDREQGCLVVSEAVSEGEVGLTKTGKAKGDRSAGTRIVYVPSSTIAVIDNWSAIRGDLGFKKSELIFALEDGTPGTDKHLRHHYKATGSSLTPYQMRHFRNDQLRRQGVPIEIRKAAMGHLSDEINSNYTHVNPEELRKYLTGE